MQGKLIVIESGTDASGKATQTETLFSRLKVEGIPVHKVEYPDYKSKSSALIKMYLNGEFGEQAETTNPYAVSTFFSVDRYASYKKEWQELYREGKIIIADRYTTSNMVHQGAKYDNVDRRQEYLQWLYDLEFNKFKLPVPDCVIFLKMPPEISNELMNKRRLKKKNNKDIHELDYDYQLKSYKTACWLAEKYNWKIVNCAEKGKLKSIEIIHQQIYKIVKKIIGQNNS